MTAEQGLLADAHSIDKMVHRMVDQFFMAVAGENRIFEFEVWCPRNCPELHKFLWLNATF